MPTVVIDIAGTDYVDRTLFSSARFMSQVNGSPGDCYIRLRDPDRAIEIPVGAEILLTIDGGAVWRGFVMNWKRVYVFPAINVDAFGETRFFDIVGTDINILFTKRIVFNQVTPEDVQGKLYPPSQSDAPVVADLVADYLDLSSDTIDTSTFVDLVGSITIDQEGRAWQAGDTWGQAMGSIAMLPAAIFYLRPTLIGSDLVYCDVDTPNAAYAMSDVAVVGGGGGGEDQVCAFLDEWDRTESGTWGTSTDGHTWADVGGGDATLSVDGSAGLAANGTLDEQALGIEGDEKWATAFEFTTIIRFDVAIGVGEYIDFTFRVNDNVTDVGHEVYIFFANPADEPSLLDVTDSATTEAEIDLAPPDTDINVKWQFTPEGLHRAKVWWSGPEPDWMVSRTDGNAPQANNQDFRIRSTSATNAETASFAPLQFCTVPTPPPPSSTAQYREMEILKDGTGLINDQLAWGIGYGSNAPVFVRDQDAASQAEHGLWQAGTVRYGIYKQGTINRVAASIVDGSPQSKRGAKNDRPSVTVSTYQTGFLPSQKIDFTSEVWDFNDVIPIRKMEVTFEAPGNPRYALTLSHEIDTPFGFIDPFFFNYSLPPFSLPPLPPFPPGPTVVDDTDGCSANAWDVFSPRDTVGADPISWGDSSRDGIPWDIIDPSGNPWPLADGVTAYVGGDYAVMAMSWQSSIAPNIRARIESGPPIGTTDWFAVLKFKFPYRPHATTTPSPNDAQQDLYLLSTGRVSEAPAIITSDFGNTITADTWYRVKFEYSHTLRLYRYRVWPDGTSEPLTWDLTHNYAMGFDMTTTDFMIGFGAFSVGMPDQSEHASIIFDWLDFNGNGPCPVSIFVGPSGFGCETPTRVNDTIFQCSASMVAGSSRVFVNGLRQRGGIALDYTESTAASGTIVFADPVAADAEVNICYVSAGPLGGGV